MLLICRRDYAPRLIIGRRKASDPHCQKWRQTTSGKFWLRLAGIKLRLPESWALVERIYTSGWRGKTRMKDEGGRMKRNSIARGSLSTPASAFGGKNTRHPSSFGLHPCL